MNFYDILLTTFSILLSLIIVFVVASIGWYLVWKLFLSRFRLVRELLGLMNDSNSATTSSSSDANSKKSIKSKKLRRD